MDHLQAPKKTNPDDTKMPLDATSQAVQVTSIQEGQPRDVSVKEGLEEGEMGADGFTPNPRFERRLVRKIDLITVPLMILIYFLS